MYDDTYHIMTWLYHYMPNIEVCFNILFSCENYITMDVRFKLVEALSKFFFLSNFNHYWSLLRVKLKCFCLWIQRNLDVFRIFYKIYVKSFEFKCLHADWLVSFTAYEPLLDYLILRSFFSSNYMVSNRYSYLITFCLHAVIWFQVTSK